MAPSSLASAFTGKTIDLPSVGRQLNVRYIAEGEIRHEGEKLFVTVRLTDTKTRKQACKAAAIAANEGRGEIPPGMGRTPLRYRDDLGFQWEDLARHRKVLCEYCFFGGPDKLVPYDRNDWFEPLPRSVIGAKPHYP